MSAKGRKPTSVFELVSVAKGGMLNLSERRVKAAKRVQDIGAPELQEAVPSGAVTAVADVYTINRKVNAHYPLSRTSHRAAESAQIMSRILNNAQKTAQELECAAKLLV